MIAQKQIVGIWGFGRVGQSIARFIAQKGAIPLVYDDYLSVDTPFKKATSREQLFAESECLIASPGVDTRPFRNVYQGTWLCELDVFQHYNTSKVIAITGSLGKTTTTHMTTQALISAGLRAECAGNIGIPMCNLLIEKRNLDWLVLELSSFQLEYSRHFAPEIALITNIYPNHLDRHGTIEEYLISKLHIAQNQSAQQCAIFPSTIKNLPLLNSIQSHITFFNESGIKANAHLVSLVLEKIGIYNAKITSPQLPHRLDHIATINGIQFINDSKSTTPISTLAALDHYRTYPILLLLGGNDKGINREELIASLRNYQVEIICFGPHAPTLHAFALKHSVSSTITKDLESGVYAAYSLAKPGNIIMLSPAGASYDLYTNYEERGNHFARIIQNLAP